MMFSTRSALPTGQTIYTGFQGCGLRFEQILNGEPGSDNFLDCPSARLSTCTTVVRHRREHPGNGDSLLYYIIIIVV